MMVVLRRCCAVLLIISFLIPSEAFARQHKKRYQSISRLTAVSAMLIDSTANRSLYGHNIDKRVYPASTTKVLTALLVLEKLTLNQYVTANASALNVQETKLGMRVGEQYRVSDLIYAILLKSANDAANVLAEAVAGSQKNFVAMMNARAQAIGATHTKFANAHGLPSNEVQYSTARDMTLIFKEALKKPFFKKVISFKYRVLYSKNGRRFFLKSHNKALFLNWKKDVEGKTGYTLRAQSCFVGYYEKKGRTYIIAVFGCRKRWEDIKFIIERYGKVDL